VANDECSHGLTEAQQEEAIFFFGVVGVADQESLLVEEDRNGLAEGDAMLPLIGRRFVIIPLEVDVGHDDIVPTL
jgi:hypothetical protein